MTYTNVNVSNVSSDGNGTSKGRLNLSGFNPLRASRSLRKGKESSSQNSPKDAGTSSKPQVVPSTHMNIHMNHKIDLDMDNVDESINQLDPIDTRAPPPKAATGSMANLAAMSRYGELFPLSGFDSSSLDPLDNLESQIQDEYEFNSIKLRRLRQTNRKSNHSPAVQRQSMEDSGKLTVVLDLDETLIHSVISPRSSIKKAKQDQGNGSGGSEDSEGCEQFDIRLCDGELVRVFKRPGLEAFLKDMSDKYELMAYTAGLKQYAEPLLNWLDPERKFFRARLYRDSCLFANGYYVKDLLQVNRDLKRTVLVDNNLCCFLPQLSNGIPISSFYDDPNDDALNVLKSFLDNLECEPDVRPALEKSFNLVNSLSSTRGVILG